MAEPTGVLFVRRLAYDFLDNLRGEYDPQRGTISAFNDFGGGVVAWTPAVVATLGVTRLRLIALALYSVAANTLVIADVAAQVYPTQDWTGSLVLGRNELGGGVTFLTNMTFTPTVIGAQMWISYIPETDRDNE